MHSACLTQGSKGINTWLSHSGELGKLRPLCLTMCILTRPHSLGIALWTIKGNFMHSACLLEHSKRPALYKWLWMVRPHSVQLDQTPLLGDLPPCSLCSYAS